MLANDSPEAAPELRLRRACAELDRRLRAGEVCRAETLLAEQPDLAAEADAAVELIYTEFVVREQLGQQPTPDAWYDRFPQWRPQLERLFHVHRALRPPSLPSGPNDSTPHPFGGSRASGTNDKAGSAANLMRWTSVRSIKENFVPPKAHGYPHMG